MTSLAVDGANQDQERSALRVVLARLHRDFDDAVGFARVERVWEVACARFNGSRIRAFVPILAERRAVVELRAAAAGRAHRPGPVENR